MNRTLIASAITGSVLLTAVLVPEPKLDIDTKLHGKTRDEVVSIKSKEIFDNAKKGKFKKNNMEIEIVNIEQIDGGVQVFAKAWKNGNPVGFGADGSVEIERFRIFNPPLLVDDPNGTITRTITAPDGRILVRTLREDPYEALKQVLKHNISLIGKEGTNIFPGKVGNTTSTFYPDAHAESTSVDGHIAYDEAGAWATARDAATGTSVDDSGTAMFFGGVVKDPSFYVRRGFLLFDTSALGADEITAAVLTAKATDRWGLASGQSYITLVSANPASNTSLTTADFDQVGSTKFSNDVTLPNGYNNSATDLVFTLNATGIAAIDGSGVSKFAARIGYDLENVALVGNDTVQAYGHSADATGTTNDPNLVVTHTSSTPPARPKMIIID